MASPDKKFNDLNDPSGLESKDKKETGKKKFEDYDIEYKKTFVCPHCHEDVPYEAEVCPHCRRYLGEKGRKTYTPISNKKAWTIKIVLGTLLIVGFVVFMIIRNA